MTLVMLAALVGMPMAVAAIETFARAGLGLGDPPLYVADPEIEYLNKPSSTFQRFGNRVAYNAYGMRSDPFPPARIDPRELRILVIGDSVTHGGALTDQRDLATERLRAALQRRLDRPVVVANASAGSWGPPNQLAYVRRFGLFDADLVVLVLNSDDAHDVPSGAPVVDVHPAYPSRPPRLATEELVRRYLPRYLPRHLAGRSTPAIIEPVDLARARAEALGALSELIALVQADAVELLLVQHPSLDEARHEPGEGHAAIGDVAERMHVPRLDLHPVFAAALAAGASPYRDAIHPNALGQRLIADALLDAVVARLGPVAADGDGGGGGGGEAPPSFQQP